MASSDALVSLRVKASKAFRAFLERTAGWTIYTNDNARGGDLDKDVRRYLPDLGMRTVFDVGAHVGTSAQQYLRQYPEATVYSFEPASDTFAQLRQALAGQQRARCFQTAFSNEPGEAEIALVGTSSMRRFVEHYEDTGGAQTESVPVDTLDHFCASNDVGRINLLKVDTEGHDLSVLEGASRMLGEARIDLVQAEVAMSPVNTLHVSFDEVKAYMESHEYYLFGLYDQIGEWRGEQRRKVLRRSNVVFLSWRAFSPDAPARNA